MKTRVENRKPVSEIQKRLIYFKLIAIWDS